MLKLSIKAYCASDAKVPIVGYIAALFRSRPERRRARRAARPCPARPPKFNRNNA
eukprot:COSAG02_NODE_1800_length_10896_cov_4.915162_10_plen_55_part_00